MNKFTFDFQGNLSFAKVIDVSIEDINTYFNSNFAESLTRANLIQTFQNYLEDLSNVIGNEPLEILIDGSFVTKKQNPNDIDILVIIPHDFLKKIDDRKILDFRCNMEQKKLTNYTGIHAFIIEEFSQNHPKYLIYQADRLHWISFFSQDRKGNKKGLLRLKY
jgi:hypothetical protein